MGKALFLVIFSGGEWWVDFEGRSHGPYASRENAALEARTLARLQQPSGRVCEVVVPDKENRYWVIWSSRHDAASGKPFVPHRVGKEWATPQ